MTNLKTNNISLNRLRHQIELVLQTRNAQDFFLGRIKHTCSLMHFNKLVREIQYASAADDPYADWVLLRIYDAIIQAERKLQLMEKTIDETLNKASGIEFKLATIKNPLKAPINFATFYARKVAGLIATYDRIVRALLAARYMGLDFSKSPTISIDQASIFLREVLVKPKEWQKTGVTRKDIRQGTVLAQQAFLSHEKLGKISETVLSKQLRAKDALSI